MKIWIHFLKEKKIKEEKKEKKRCAAQPRVSLTKKGVFDLKMMLVVVESWTRSFMCIS